MTKLLFFLLVTLSLNAFSQTETYILEGSSARSFTSTITYENPGDFGMDLEYQRRLTDDNYQAPVLNSTPGDMFRNSIAGLFNQSVQYSRREQERMAQQMRTAVRYDQLARLAPEIQRRLNEHIRSAQAYREHVHRQAARTIDIMESVNRIKRSKYRKTKERALFNATRIKLDYTSFEGRLKDKFNAVRAKYWSVKEEHFVSEKSYEFLDMGATSYFDALDKYTNNDESGAERSLELSNTFLDIALGSTPFVGMFKDAYEAYSGKSLLTNEALTQTERALSVVGFGVGLMTGGTLSGAVKLLPKLMPYAKNIVSSGVSILKSARKSIPIKTPFGKATQEMTKHAIAARAKVQNGGHMYRLGKRGRSQTGKDAQFWSLEHPKTPGYAQKYGIPEENIANADFIERATIKDGSNFVTRKAPAVGSNKGGGIEIVTTKDGVNIESHTTLD